MALPDKILARKLKKKEKKKQQLPQEKKEDVNTSINGNLLLKIKFVNKGKIWTKKIFCSSITICPFIFNFDNNFDKLWF